MATTITTPKAFGLDNHMISAGLIQLNKVSSATISVDHPSYEQLELDDTIADNIMAEILITPTNTADIFQRENGTRLQDLRDIRSIDTSYGFQYEGYKFEGMKVYDKCEDGHDTSLAVETAINLQETWLKVKSSGQAHMTGLFIGTEKISGSRKIGEVDVSGLEPNDRSGFYQWSCAPLHMTWFYLMNDDVIPLSDMPRITLPSRPVALKILPPAA